MKASRTVRQTQEFENTSYPTFIERVREKGWRVGDMYVQVGKGECMSVVNKIFKE